MREQINSSKEIITYSELVSSGRNLESWINHFQGKEIVINEYVIRALRLLPFQVTSNVTYQTTLIKGSVFHDDVRCYDTIKNVSENFSWFIANTEAFFLTIDELSKEKLTENQFGPITLINKLEINGESFVLNYNGTNLSYWPIPSTVHRFFGWNENNSFLFLKSIVPKA